MATAISTGMRDLWAVYDANYEELSEPAAKAVEAVPELKDVLVRLKTKRHATESAGKAATTRALVGHAMETGDWDQYLADIRSIGATYARADLDPGVWAVAFTEFRSACLWKLRDAYRADVDQFASSVDALSEFTDRTMTAVSDEYLAARQEIINQQQEAIRELSTPVLKLRQGLLILPLIGVIDSERARRFTASLLTSIRTNRARIVIIDLTGVAAVDTAVANHLLLAAKAARLLGATAMLSGISTATAETLARLGVDMGEVQTVSDLETALADADRILGTAASG